jgi:hypothetical protein
MSERKEKTAQTTPQQRKSQRGRGKGKAPAKKAPKAPAWWKFTTKASQFARAAAALANALTMHYGNGVSIAHFERFLSELPGLTAEQTDLCPIAEEVILNYEKYLDAREGRELERESFRSFRTAQAVGSGLEKAKQLLAEEKKTR